MVLEVDGVHAVNNLGGLEDEVNVLAGVDALLGLSGGGLLDVSGPGDVLEGVLLEEIAAPLSELVESLALFGGQRSVLVLADVVAAEVLGFGTYLSVVDQPVGVLVLVADELAVVVEYELNLVGGVLR